MRGYDPRLPPTSLHHAHANLAGQRVCLTIARGETLMVVEVVLGATNVGKNRPVRRVNF